MFGVILFLAWIVFSVLFIVSLVKKNGKAKRNFLIGLASFVLFIVVISTTTETDSDADVAEETAADGTSEEKKPQKKEEEPKEELFVKLESSAYSKDTDAVTLNLTTNLPENTEVYASFRGEGETDFPLVPDHGKVQNGKVQVVIGDYEDEYDGSEYVINGTYPISASFSVDKDLDSNKHLLDELGEFKEVNKKYKFNGNLTETEKGYVVEDIALGDMEIKDAYTQEQVDQMKLEKKKGEATTIDFKQLEKNPDRYTGEYVKYTGEIVQILEGNDTTNIRLAVTKTSYGYNPGEIVFIEYEGYTDFVDGDIVTIYGEVYGKYSYESQAGYNISLPGIVADIVE
ncbi:hypothetical protein [Bacillus sp. UMB0728]|uniref:hypothetical protein n=1 Tax=Bacillus sp. UMB0728 TaxID=2066052 RepID=UPI000C771A62|nr:hypothetical protein [Bacillus sp. UMB0728]PLR73520.1 hypothetical protein CYJ37_08250 [Bacillus sp. UMB0728]